MNREAAHEAEAVPGEKNQFDVRADGKVIFSKEREGRWPTTEEIIDSLSA